MLALARRDVRELVPIQAAIDLVATAFQDLSAGKALSPLRTGLSVQPERATTLVMPAYVPAAHALGLKVVSVFRDNPKRGLPTITSMVCIVDDETGQPLALLEGAYLTALRTGAVSGAATRLLAREDARNLLVIGSGAQGLTQAAAVAAVRDLDRIVVAGRSEEGLARFRERCIADWPDLVDRLETTTGVAAAVREADIICTATTSSSPVFEDTDVRPGTHINGVGSFTPTMQEVPSATVQRSIVIVDQVEAALEEAGDLIVPLREGLIDEGHLSRELGALVSGAVTGRTSAEDVTFFKSVGNAVQDMAVAKFAYNEAVRRGIGQEIDLGAM
ncbi:MAG TPA: ornithine cyclodeaminase [Thermomicrobiales bacterium]|nr:ornithine cyclodeaminase [Thermomicrobiales bacterium]